MGEAKGTVAYRWKADEPGFRDAGRVGRKEQWQVVSATTECRSKATPLKNDEFDVRKRESLRENMAGNDFVPDEETELSGVSACRI